MISTASAAEVDRLLHDEPITARKLAERLAVMRHLYWTAEATDAERQALLVVWTEALSGTPAPFVVAAFGEWFATGTHRPTPGHIAKRARELEAHARNRRENLARSLNHAPLAPAAPDEAELRRRRDLAAEMAAKFPMLKRVPTSEAD